jgi:hypothetical protein
MSELLDIINQLQGEKIEQITNGYHITKATSTPSEIKFTTRVITLIWPSKEGEIIENIENLPTNFSYSLSYPGTASTKSIVLYETVNKGIFIGSKPTESFCKLKITRVGHNKVKVSFESTEHDFIAIPFEIDWKQAIPAYKKYYRIIDMNYQKSEPKILLQIGAIAPECQPRFSNFNDLRIVVDKFHNAFGSNNIIHLFGTDSAGFDRMYPQYNISPELGGEASLKTFLEYVHSKGMMTSHHFIPRIADYDWVTQNPDFKESIVTGINHENVPMVELYKGHPFYIMNINHQKWFDICLKTVKRLHGLGFDYVQLDQICYQRTFYNPDLPFAVGYKKLIKSVESKGINYWLEGISDIYRPRGKDFGQILIRNTPNLWEDFEQRRGYPFGRSYPEFYTSIYPNDNYSYQIITENKSLENVTENLAIAQKINAKVYDLQMDYFSEKYMDLLTDTIKLLHSLKSWPK